MILNFFFDFILLLSVSILLRRNVSIYKIMGGAFIGGISIIFLFIELNNLTLFFYKLIISILMILISFGYKNIKYTFKNILYLYTASIILGGFLYFLNVEFAYKQYGLVFIHQGLSINVIFLIIFILSRQKSPVCTPDGSCIHLLSHTICIFHLYRFV